MTTLAPDETIKKLLLELDNVIVEEHGEIKARQIVDRVFWLYRQTHNMSKTKARELLLHEFGLDQ